MPTIAISICALQWNEGTGGFPWFMALLRSIKKEKNSILEGLAKRIAKGDVSALDGFIKETQGDLYRFCFYLTGKKQLAEELAQDTYLKVVECISELKDYSQLKSWLCRIAKNQLIDQTRSAEHKLQKLSSHSDEENDILEGITSPGASNVEDIVTLQGILNQLDVEDRTVLVLAHHEEKSSQEIAEILQITDGAVRMRLSRARKNFLELYKKEEN